VSGAPRPRVLVADDHRLIASLLTRALEEAGYEVLVEMSGDRVAHAAIAGRPDIAIVDANMKPFERFRALVELSELDADERPAIVALSGDDEPVVRDRALQLGADAFLLKPWEPDELIELVERLMAGRRTAAG